MPTLLLLQAALAADAVPSEVVEVSERAAVAPDPLATSAAVTVLLPDERVSASADVGSLVESAAGTNVQRLGGIGDFAAVSIRGASLRQVEVFIDGVPLNPDGADVVNLSELPLGAFQRIEVWRGKPWISPTSSWVRARAGSEGSRPASRKRSSEGGLPPQLSIALARRST